MNRLRYLKLVTIVGLLLTTSCASYFKRKECEKTNWFKHGEQVAMRGERLNEDSFIKECEKAEAKISHSDLDLGFKKGMGRYCEPDNVFQYGKQGKFVNFKMCDGHSTRKLKEQHARGVQAFCRADNGKTVGAQGWEYNNICPKNLEADFLPEYRKGRKIYLQGQVRAIKDEIRDLDNRIRGYQQEKQNLTYRLANIPSSRVMVKERILDPKTQAYREQVRYQEDPQIKERRDRITRDIDGKERNIRQARQRQSNLRKQQRELETEMHALN